MDFKDSPEDAAFRAEVRVWLDSQVALKDPNADRETPMFTDEPERVEAIEVQQTWQKRLYDAGLGVLTWPKEYGGREATPMQNFIFREELQRYDVPSTEIYLVPHGMVGPTIITHGTDEQKSRWIPKMAEGSEIWCQLWSEPGAGSDLASLQSRCEPDGEGNWILNGQKVWTTGAQWSRWGLIITRTDTSVPKHRGLTVFVVDMQAPGVTVVPLRQITGGADFNEVFFDDVVIPDTNRIGDINDGWRVAMTTLMFERYAVGTGGSGEGMVRPLVKLAKRLSRNGGVAMDDGHVRQEIADAFVKAKLLTLTGYRSLTKIAKGQQPGAEGSIMKLVRTALLYDVADIGTELLGMAGALMPPHAADDGLWALNFVGSPGAKIGGGTDEIMRNILGERVLGLPKEPQVDRDQPFKELKR